MHIVDLQGCVNFMCARKWFSYTHTHIHIYAYIFFFSFFLTIGYYKILNIVPRVIYSPCLVTISWFSLSVSLFLSCK